jgi:hypothetical protein
MKRQSWCTVYSMIKNGLLRLFYKADFFLLGKNKFRARLDTGYQRRYFYFLSWACCASDICWRWFSVLLGTRAWSRKIKCTDCHYSETSTPKISSVMRKKKPFIAKTVWGKDLSFIHSSIHSLIQVIFIEWPLWNRYCTSLNLNHRSMCFPRILGLLDV